MPQRNAKCFNSFAPFLSGCHLQGFFLCPEVICSGWTIKAIMVAACFSIMRRDDWQHGDDAGVEGHLASIYLIWKHFFFLFLCSLTYAITHKQTTQLSTWDFFFFFHWTHLSESFHNIFQLPFSPSQAEHLSVTVRDQMRSRGCQQCNKIPRGMVGTDV